MGVAHASCWTAEVRRCVACFKACSSLQSTMKRNLADLRYEGDSVQAHLENYDCCSKPSSKYFRVPPAHLEACRRAPVWLHLFHKFDLAWSFGKYLMGPHEWLMKLLVFTKPLPSNWSRQRRMVWSRASCLSVVELYIVLVLILRLSYLILDWSDLGFQKM